MWEKSAITISIDKSLQDEIDVNIVSWGKIAHDVMIWSDSAGGKLY
jgi:hypothetical protein